MHEIQDYLKTVETLIYNLKTELDLTRNLLYRTWLKRQSDCKLAATIETIPEGFSFFIKKVGRKNPVLTVEESSGNDYEKITNQLQELGFGSRRKEHRVPLQINKSGLAYEHIRAFLLDLPYESLYLLLLDSSSSLIKTVCVSEGGISGTVVDPKKVFKIALDNFATGLIMCHNHPSGNLQPSNSDVELTKKIMAAGKLLDINILDHIIIGVDGYFSFSDEGMMG